MDKHFFCIAGHDICIEFAPSELNSMQLLPSFTPFSVTQPRSPLILSLTVDDSIKPAEGRKLLRKFDTGNGDTLVYTLPDGGYQFIIRDIYNRDCALAISNHDFSLCRVALNGDAIMRSFGLNDTLMLAYAFAGSFKQTALIHASCIRYEGKAYPFIAKSGTGKSTHSSMWMQHIEGAELLNDDNPIIRIINGQAMVYGSPWSGKTPCYRNTSAALGAVTRIERAPENAIEKLAPVQAFASLLPACSTMKWDSAIYNNLCDMLSELIAKTSVYTMHCRPDKEAAIVCHHTIAAK